MTSFASVFSLASLNPFMNRSGRVRVASAVLAVGLVACSSSPPAPEWKRLAQAASEKATQAYLSGRDGVAQAELKVAREEASRTGLAVWLAQVELTQCAAQVASLVPLPCEAYQPLQVDSTPAQQVYARYLSGVLLGEQDIAKLPTIHQSMARQLSAGRVVVPEVGKAVLSEEAALAHLVGAGVALKRGQADAALVQRAIDLAAQQGWRRPLMAWLGWARDQSLRQGLTQQAGHWQRRMDWIEHKGQPMALPGPSKPPYSKQ